MSDQHSALRVKLSDLIEGMDFQSDEQSSFLNLTTGEVVSITDEELRAAENNEPLEDFPERTYGMICATLSVVEERSGVSKTGCSCMGWLKSGTGIVMQPYERLPWRGAT